MVNLKIIEGGLLPKEKREKRLISAYITDTRLMGVIGMHIHWEIVNSPETEDLHQFFYFDCEENGFETYKSVWSDDSVEIEAIKNVLIGGLGGRKIFVSVQEAATLLLEYIEYNKEHNLMLPEGFDEYRFLIDNLQPLTKDESLAFFKKQCGEIKADYQVVNYFLMRCFGKDFFAAKFLTDGNVDVDLYPNFPLLTLCKNTIDEKDGAYVCESLIEFNGKYQIIVNEIEVEDLKVVGYKKISGFPITTQEAAMQLSRPEFLTVYELLDGPEGIENDRLELEFNTMVSTHENGKLFLAFNKTNNHVNQKVFRLSEDVFGMYYMTNSGQFLAASYSMPSIKRLEKNLMNSSMGSYLIPVAKYEFKNPVLSDFIQSDFDDFDDFLEVIRDDD